MIVIVTVYFLLGLSETRGKTEAIVDFNVSEDVVKTKSFRFSLYSRSNILEEFNYEVNRESEPKKIIVPSGNDSIVGVFESTTDFKKWSKIIYPFILDKKLKRIEIKLYFGINDNKVEFLEELTVYKYYAPKGVYIKPVFKKQIGERPFFRIVNKSNQTYVGNFISRHFYGCIKEKKDDEWYEFRGSYCGSTKPIEPLKKNGTTYSCIPNYRSDNDYRIKNPGTYTYTVVMLNGDDSEGILSESIDQAKTTLRTNTRYELETTFVIRRKK